MVFMVLSSVRMTSSAPLRTCGRAWTGWPGTACSSRRRAMNVHAAGASTTAGGALGQQASLSRVPDGVTRPSGGCDAARAAANPSWRLHSFGGIAALVKEDAGVPALTRPTDVLVEVHAASVNPLDVEMTEGYGAAVLESLREARSFVGMDGDAGNLCEDDDDGVFPLTLGRDFSGRVAALGCDADAGLEVGAEVFGVILPSQRRGTHARYVVADQALVCRKPSTVSHSEAAAATYAGMTALSALTHFGGLPAASGGRQPLVLVVGAAGGVGHLALQLAKARGARVVAVCGGEEAGRMSRDLGADDVVDYKQEESYDGRLKEHKGFDLILDCSGQDDTRFHKYLKKGAGPNYVSLTSPFLRNTGSRGLVFGTLLSLQNLLEKNVSSERILPHRWGYFLPLPGSLREIGSLMEQQKLRPVIQKTFPFDDTPSAYDLVKNGSLRGKVSIEMR